MNTNETQTNHGAPAVEDAPSLVERLSTVVREALLTNDGLSLAVNVKLVVLDVLAELCPPNHLLLSAEVLHEHDSGTVNTDGNEPAYDYAAIRDFVILHDTVEATPAALLTFAAELGETAPDGTGTLDQQIGLRFAQQQADMLEKSREKSKYSPFSASAVSNALRAAETNRPLKDRSTT